MTRTSLTGLRIGRKSIPWLKGILKSLACPKSGRKKVTNVSRCSGSREIENPGKGLRGGMDNGGDGKSVKNLKRENKIGGLKSHENLKMKVRENSH